MAYDTSIPLLDDTLAFIESEFGITADQARIDSWIAEIQGEGGRSVEQLRADILKYMVGEDAIAEWVTNEFGDSPVDADRAARIAGEILAGERTFSSVRTDIRAATGQVAPAATDEATAFDAPVDEDEGESIGDEAYPGLMAGGTIYQIEREGQADRYVYAFEQPPGSGYFMAFEFDSLDQIEQAVGPDWWKTIGYDNTHDEAWLLGENVAIMGDIGAVSEPGDFAELINTAGLEAAAAAGITDPSLVGKMLADEEIQFVMGQATIAGWEADDPRYMAALRSTTFWTETLYPGIENLYGRTTEPEQAWMEYSRNVEGSLIELGYQRDPDGTFNTSIAAMLDAGIEEETFIEFTPTFLRAERNSAYLDTLNMWAAEDGLEATFDDLFDILSDNTPAELANVVEKANLQYQADLQAVSITSEQIERIGDLADLTEAQAAQAFGQYSEIVTSLAGAIGPNQRYDLTSDDVLSLATGITPASGRSIEEIRTKSLQAARELGALDDEKIQFFVGYDPKRGTPNRPGLNPLAPEGA